MAKKARRRKPSRTGDNERITMEWWKEFTGQPRKPYVRLDDKTKIVFTEEFGVSIMTMMTMVNLMFPCS